MCGRSRSECAELQLIITVFLSFLHYFIYYLLLFYFLFFIFIFFLNYYSFYCSAAVTVGKVSSVERNEETMATDRMLFVSLVLNISLLREYVS